MKILLINNNPVVSRLTALSARKENVDLDEIKTIAELKASDYDIIFVDGESYNNDVSNIIRNSGVKRKVLFYTQGEKEDQSIFTGTILKPFLPSEVSEILRETKVAILKEKEQTKTSVDFKDLVEEKKDKELEVLNIIDKKEKKEPTKTPTPMTNETSNKDKFEEKLKDAFPINLDEVTLDDVSLDDIKTKKQTDKIVEKKENKSNKKEMFDLDSDLFELDTKKDTDISDSDLFDLDDKKVSSNKIDNELFEIDKEMKIDILNDAPLDFDADSKNEVNFEPEKPKVAEIKKEEIKKEELPQKEISAKEVAKKEPKQEEITTKVLDNTEISNIKDILEEKEGAESLTEIPNSLMSIKESMEKPKDETIVNEKSKEEEKKEDVTLEQEILTKESSSIKKKKKKKKKKNNFDNLTTGAAIAHTLSKLPVKDLRHLLRGAKVNVSIEFPNEV